MDTTSSISENIPSNTLEESHLTTPLILDSSRTLLAYFSHSYHPSEKEINLFFWKLLSKYHLYFTVDPEESRDQPMNISYLEWMMRRCACFVAVIPRRDDSPLFNCSPYQIFENGLAIRAGKPRLIFVEEGLDRSIFGKLSDEICSFNRREELLKEKIDMFVEFVERLVLRAHGSAFPSVDLKNPIGFLVDTTQGTVYDSAAVKHIRRTVRDQGYSFRTVNPTEFEQDFVFLGEMEEYSLLISEVRRPYIEPEVLGLVHKQCIPMIRICHLKEHENGKDIGAAMHLPLNEGQWIDRDSSDLPIIFSKYQIDDNMEPIIFWKDVNELGEKIRTRLKKIAEKRDDLLTEQDAVDYFLRIGRLPGQLFISNAQSQNEFVYELKRSLKRNAIKWFHYKDKEAIPIGSENWLSEIIMEIRNSIIFVAIIDSKYELSPWCMSELAEAMKLYRKGAIELHAYVVSTIGNKDSQAPDSRKVFSSKDKNEVEMPVLTSQNSLKAGEAESESFLIEKVGSLPEELKLMQVPYIDSLDEPDKIARIVDNTITFLETGKQVHLRSRNREQIVNILAELPSFASPNECKALLKEAVLPDQIIEKVRTNAPISKKAAEEIVDDLAKREEEIAPRTKALGLLLSHIMGFVDSVEEERFLADMIRNYKLMPDIRLYLESYKPFQELGLAYFHEREEIGVFKSIKDGKLDPTNKLEPKKKLDAHLYAISVRATAKNEAWKETLLSIGEGLFQKNPYWENIFENYKKLIEEQGVRHEQIEFCFATDVPGLRIPFEWAIMKGHNSPLCLRHPVRRFLEGSPEPRIALRKMLEGEEAIPLRVLLVASNTDKIGEVENEVDELYEMFCQFFDLVGWPKSNICKLNSQKAIPSRIEEEIRTGHYHIFHFAGHGNYEDVRPIIKVFADETMTQPKSISAVELKNWINDSDLRFVYISSCRSASTEAPELGKVIQNFENIAHAIVQARVPEVIGFVWPIEDTDSRILAQRFYKYFLEGFNRLFTLF